MWKQIGQRPTVTRATQRVLRSFVDWGVLTDASERGVYKLGQIRSVADPALTAWLVEANMRAANETHALLNALRRNPALFPFSLHALTQGFSTDRRGSGSTVKRWTRKWWPCGRI